MVVELTRRSHFSAAHRLYNPEMSEEENCRVYGACANPYGHGHTYFLEVTIEGEPDPRTGMIINIDELDQIIKSRLINDLDHHHLNHDVPFLKEVIPTMENLVVVFWQRLEGQLPSGRLKRIRLWETEKNSVIYYGPADTKNN